MPAYIQSKVFAYKGWHPPNFRVYIPPKVPKDTEREEPEPGEIIEEPKEDDDATISRNANLEPPSDGEQTIEEDTHLDEDIIQEQLLPCSLEPVELGEAVVESDANEDLQSSKAVNAQDELLGEEKADEGNDADVEAKEDSGAETKMNGEVSHEQASATDKTPPSKKKSKPKKKRSASEEESQSLGDKVTW